MSLQAQQNKMYAEDPLLRVLSTLKNEAPGNPEGSDVSSGGMTPAQLKLAEQAKALGMNMNGVGTTHAAPVSGMAEMTAAALRAKAPNVAQALVYASPSVSLTPAPTPVQAPAPATISVSVSPAPAPAPRPPEPLAPVIETETKAPPVVASVLPQPRRVEVEEQKSMVPESAPPAELRPPIPVAPVVDMRPKAPEPMSVSSVPQVASVPSPAVVEGEPEVVFAAAPEPKEAPTLAQMTSISTPLPQIEIRDEEFHTEMDSEPEVLRPQRRERTVIPPEDGDTSDVTVGDVLPLVGGRRRVATTNRKSMGALRTILQVLGVQALLVVFGLGVLWASSDARSAFRKFAHRVLGTSAIIAGAEPHWTPDLSVGNEGDDGGGVAFQQLGMMQGKISELERQLSVTPAEAWKELRLLSQRNQLTAYADESITLGSRKAYMELKDVAETSKDPTLRYAAEAEILRIRFFYASGSRLGGYKLPTATLYPDGATKKDEDLSSDELTTLLLDKTKEWEIRSRAAYLLGDRRGYEVARSLVEAVRTDECLDVVEQAMYSFEEITAYRSPGAFEIQHLLNWWDDNSAKLKSQL